MVVIMQNTLECRHTGDKFNATKTRKICVDGINCFLGKNRGHKLSCLGYRLIVVVRKKVSETKHL